MSAIVEIVVCFVKWHVWSLWSGYHLLPTKFLESHVFQKPGHTHSKMLRLDSWKNCVTWWVHQKTTLSRSHPTALETPLPLPRSFRWSEEGNTIFWIFLWLNNFLQFSSIQNNIKSLYLYCIFVFRIALNCCIKSVKSVYCFIVSGIFIHN